MINYLFKMEKLLALSANAIIGYSFYEMYNYYILKQLEHKIKPAVSIDMSYEEIPDKILNTKALIATSIDKINKGNENFVLSKKVEESGIRDNIVKVIFCYFKFNIEKEFLVLKDIELLNSRSVIFLDPPVLKSQKIESDTKLTPFQAVYKFLLKR
jgi:hypothetical protein